MKRFLLVAGVLASCGCVYLLTQSRSSLRDIEALLFGVVAIVSFAAVGIIEALESVRAWLPAQPKSLGGAEPRTRAKSAG